MRLFEGDCLSVLKGLPDNSVDSIVTDPPYGLSFMGKKWDYDVPSVEIWRECLRVLKSGGHLLAFAGSRTYHRMAVNIEDAGFEIRDQIMWVYGSGFPKSHNISKAMDKVAGAQREIIGNHNGSGMTKSNVEQGAQNRNVMEWSIYSNDPITDKAKQWDGWGSALKPAHEPIVVARKPLIGTIVENVLEHGTGGLNIDGCRIPTNGEQPKGSGNSQKNTLAHGDRNALQGGSITPPQGRFPANFIHDGSDEVVSLFPQSNGGAFPKKSNVATGEHYEGGWGNVDNGIRTEMGDGSAARFFYCAKASQQEKNLGVDESNIHPTVKPVDLMKYLCRLVTPPEGLVLDPFMGSGTTGIAAKVEGFDFIGIEMNAEYLEIAEARIGHWVEEVETTYKSLYEWL